MTGSAEYRGCPEADHHATYIPERFFASTEDQRRLPYHRHSQIMTDQSAGFALPPRQPGLVAGTTVLTADGIIPVELLTPGDRIVTRNTGLVRLAHLTFSQYDGDFIAITARSLAETRPDTDTIIPAAQTVLLRGTCAQMMTGHPAALVSAEKLAGISGVTLHQGIEMTLVQLVFDRPQLVYADGLETLCLADTEDRLAA